MAEWKDTPFPPGLRHEPLDLGVFEVQSEEWHAVRAEGIGASDTPSILGAPGAFSTCLQVWAQKIAPVSQKKFDERTQEILDFGHKMEPLIGAELRERTGYEVRPEPRTLAHPDHPFVRANLDSWVCVEGVWGPGEFKNTSTWVADQWDDSVPLKYQVQTQQQMFVAGAEISVVATLLGGNQFLWTTLERNDEFIEVMLQKLTRFWNMVQDNEMPRACELDLELLKDMNEPDPDVITVLPIEALHWAAQIEGAKEEQKEWESVKRGAEAQVWHALGNATIGELPDNSGQFRVITTKKGGKYLKYKEVK